MTSRPSPVPLGSMRATELVTCSQTTSPPSRSKVIPLPLFEGLATSVTPSSAVHRRRTSPGMSLKSRNPSGLHNGPSVNVNPVPSRSSSASAATSSRIAGEWACTAMSYLSLPIIENPSSKLTDGGGNAPLRGRDDAKCSGSAGARPTPRRPLSRTGAGGAKQPRWRGAPRRPLRLVPPPDPLQQIAQRLERGQVVAGHEAVDRGHGLAHRRGEGLVARAALQGVDPDHGVGGPVQPAHLPAHEEGVVALPAVGHDEHDRAPGQRPPAPHVVELLQRRA